MLHSNHDTSLGIYISVPFCRSKCTYCNFASGVYSSAHYEPYVAQVCREIWVVRQAAAEWGAIVPNEVDSVYLGGGTPSVLGPELLTQIGKVLRQEFAIAHSAEITVECAPGQLDDASLEAALELGLNRVSFGVQSFIDREAAITGRLHTRESALADIQRVRTMGIERINVDLIAGLPGQTRQSWDESLEVLCSAGVDHASIYMLEIDEDSRLGREILAGGFRYHTSSVPDEELTAELYEIALARLRASGIEQYEISNFSRSGGQSRHNRKYWRREPYLGFGLDAHSYLERAEEPGIRCNTASEIDEYLAGSRFIAIGGLGAISGPQSGWRDVHELSSIEELEETWFLGLRLAEGISWKDLRFQPQSSEDALDAYRSIADELCRLDLLQQNDGRIRLTQKGMLLSNDVFSRFLGVPSMSSSIS